MKCIPILGHKWIHMESDQIGFTDSFNFEKKMYSDSRFLVQPSVELLGVESSDPFLW